MTYLHATIVIVLVTSGAALVSWLLGRGVPADVRRRHHDVGTPVFQEVGVMVSVLLAFVFSQVWSEYRTAAEAINDECGALHGAAILASALPMAAGQPVIRAVAAYTEEVVHSEWPAMAQRHRSPIAAAGVQTAISEGAKLSGAPGGDPAVRSQIVSLLIQAHTARETRIFQVTQSLPPFMWFMLIAISSVLVLFVAAAGLDGPGRIMFVVVFTASVSLVLVLVRMLDFPFEGALALPNSDFLKLLGETQTLAKSLT